jgi:bifunctional DNase/RNase
MGEEKRIQMTRQSLLLFVWCSTLGIPGFAEEPKSLLNTPPEGFTEMTVAGVLPHDEGNTVILADGAHEVFLPIGIGDSAALAIYLRLEHKRFPRPLTHDLVDQIMRHLGGRLVKVQIEALRDDTFHGTLYLRVKNEIVHIDARASDALALALGNRVPIFVKDAVLKRAAIRPADLRELEQTDSESQVGEERVFNL